MLSNYFSARFLFGFLEVLVGSENAGCMAVAGQRYLQGDLGVVKNLSRNSEKVVGIDR